MTKPTILVTAAAGNTGAPMVAPLRRLCRRFAGVGGDPRPACNPTDVGA